MNEWQKELVKVAGEMSTSKERIKKTYPATAAYQTKKSPFVSHY